MEYHEYHSYDDVTCSTDSSNDGIDGYDDIMCMSISLSDVLFISFKPFLLT